MKYEKKNSKYIVKKVSSDNFGTCKLCEREKCIGVTLCEAMIGNFSYYVLNDPNGYDDY